MKIAVTYENGEAFQHFGHTEQFKIYDVENGKIANEQVVNTNGSGHGALAGFLHDAKVDASICGGIGMGAQMALADAGIKLYAGVQGSADAAAKALTEGTLEYDPDAHCDHHGHHHDGDCGHDLCAEHNCEGNYEHMAQILTSIAIYEVLQKHGKTEEEAYKAVSEERWKFLDPSGMQKLSKVSFFMPLMKKIGPLGFSKKSGIGWRGLMKLGAMCCHADIINYGKLHYTDFIRTKTLCQGGDFCDFRFIRHDTDAGDGWERTESI